jgi:hypothetical protein
MKNMVMKMKFCPTHSAALSVDMRMITLIDILFAVTYQN